MAARIARNTGEFLESCRRQETPTFVLSGEDEADLGFLAVAQDPLFSDAGRLTIVDPGGHSTELVTAQRQGDGWRTLFRRSFPVGALGLRDALWPHESPGFRERLAAVAAVDDAIGLRYLPRQCGLVVTLGATGTNLVSIRDVLTEWEPDRVHGAVLDFEEVSKAVGWMCDMTDSERAAIPGLERGREKTIHAGALILERFLHAAAALETAVSVRGWRHALLSREDVGSCG
jgi:exopolyphosphatase/guanosine-5'-triphosphate,3'-diphosphate pyrophosphatase